LQCEPHHHTFLPKRNQACRKGGACYIYVYTHIYICPFAHTSYNIVSFHSLWVAPRINKFKGDVFRNGFAFLLASSSRVESQSALAPKVHSQSSIPESFLLEPVFKNHLEIALVGQPQNVLELLRWIVKWYVVTMCSPLLRLQVLYEDICQISNCIFH